MIKLTDLVKERFQDVMNMSKKEPNEWIDLSNDPIKDMVKKDEPTKENLFNLVQMTKHIGDENSNLKSINDVLSTKYDHWEAINFDEDPDADAVIFGRNYHGIELIGIGHDGNQRSKDQVVKRLIELLKSGKFWMEASFPLSKVLLQAGLQPFKDENKIKSIFPDSTEWQFFKDGSYVRDLELGKKTDNKYIFGNPK
jgi:hypothetical protein